MQQDRVFIPQASFSFGVSEQLAAPPAIAYGNQLTWEKISHEPQFSLQPNAHFADLIDIGTPAKPVDTAFSSEIVSGKNTYVYDAHTYHTKVPPAGIKTLIEYYTDSGAVVLDPFCGSGMTGVAALEAGRKVLLSDLSTAATFIAYNHCTPIGEIEFLKAVDAILSQSRALEAYLYTTRSRETSEQVPVLYTVWSYGYICKECAQEFVLWDVARDEKASVRESKILSTFSCPHCAAQLNKRGLERTKRYPVQIGYPNPRNRQKESTAVPSAEDIKRIEEIDLLGVPSGLWVPTTDFPTGINTRQPISAGISRVDQAYTKRALWAMAHLWQAASDWPQREVREKLLFALTSLYKRVTVFSEFRFWGGSGNTANFNVPSIMNEQNVFRAFERKARTISWYFAQAPKVSRELRISCQSATDLYQLPACSVDYVFTDPPFGGNINYSEMNTLWEAWLGKRTEIAQEAIVNRFQNKGIPEYRELLASAFREIARVLKKGAWATIIFHNSSAEVWAALQDAVECSGLKIRGTQTFDKKHGTFKQFVSKNAVGYDLMLHCQADHGPQAARTPQTSDNIKEFIERRLRESPSYSVEYLHVRRHREFDYRRLYAEWLSKAVSDSRVEIGFETFRDLVDQVRLKLL